MCHPEQLALTVACHTSLRKNTQVLTEHQWTALSLMVHLWDTRKQKPNSRFFTFFPSPQRKMGVTDMIETN